MSHDVFDWRNSLFEQVHSHLQRSGYDIKIENQKTICINGSEILLRDSLAVIQNNQTGEYYCLDCHDWQKPEDMDLYLNDDKCVKILKCQYCNDAYNAHVDKILPWTYFDRYWPLNENRLRGYRNTKHSINKLYFRGQTWGIRENLLNELIRFGVMNTDYSVIDFDKYLDECSQHKIMLSLPGVADVCHRDIEGFASGVCVLRPRIQNNFHNSLIPGYHYISVDIDIRKDDAVKCARTIKEKFEAALGDPAFIDDVANNAVRWYDNNVRRENALKLTEILLELER